MTDRNRRAAVRYKAAKPRRARPGARAYSPPQIVHTESVLPQVMTASVFNDCQSESCAFPDKGC